MTTPAKHKNFRVNSISQNLIAVASSEDIVLSWPNPNIPPPLQNPQFKTDYLPLILNARVYDAAIETPLQHARKLSARYGSTIYLKREDMQPINSFKNRGAFNKMYNLTKSEKERGVACCSAGNHAQGVALASSILGVSATIVMPIFAPEIKVENVRRLGAKVILFGNSFDDAKKEALRIVAAENLAFIPPFDDPLVIAGQGTIGMEILNQIKHTRLDAIFICCGGGGMLAGISAYVKRVRPEIKIVGVNTTDSDSMYQSLLARKPVELATAGLFSDGTSVKLVGQHCLDVCMSCVDDMILVTNDEICAAIKDTYEESRCILEPSGALGLAGLKKILSGNQGLKNGVFAAVCSGANMNFDRLRFVAEQASIGAGNEALLSVRIPEVNGSLLILLEKMLPHNITELSYRFANTIDAHIFCGFNILDRSEVVQMIKQINETPAFEAIDISENQMASEHVRYMNGGKSVVQEELVFRLRLPERAGSLRDFFLSMEKSWEITLFHYRNHGADYGRVLAGIRGIDGTDKGAMDAWVGRLKSCGVRDVIEETLNPVYKHFIKGCTLNNREQSPA